MMRVAISGLNNTDNPAPGIGVAKSLKNHTLIGLSYDANEPGVYQHIFEKVYLMPYPTLGYEELKNRLSYIKEKSDIEFVFANLDAELPLYIKYQDDLKELGINSYLPSFKCFEMREKRKLAEFSKSIGVKHPKTIEVFSLDELVKAVNEIGFPLMIKGNYYKAFKAINLDEAIEFYYKISNEWGFPILVQQIVNGVEINYVGVGDGEKLIAGVGMKKLLTTSLGKVWSGVSIKNEKLIEVSKKFVEKIGWRGAFEFEAISDGKDIYLIEINPRFPAWVYFATSIGVNLPEIILRLSEGEKVEVNLEYPYEKMYVRFTEETVVDFREFSEFSAKKEI